MKKHRTIEAVYIYIYIVRFNEIESYKHRMNKEAMYFRRI